MVNLCHVSTLRSHVSETTLFENRFLRAFHIARSVLMYQENTTTMINHVTNPYFSYRQSRTLHSTSLLVRATWPPSSSCWHGEQRSSWTRTTRRSSTRPCRTAGRTWSTPWSTVTSACVCAAFSTAAWVIHACPLSSFWNCFCLPDVMKLWHCSKPTPPRGAPS